MAPPGERVLELWLPLFQGTRSRHFGPRAGAILAAGGASPRSRRSPRRGGVLARIARRAGSGARRRWRRRRHRAIRRPGRGRPDVDGRRRLWRRRCSLRGEARGRGHLRHIGPVLLGLVRRERNIDAHLLAHGRLRGRRFAVRIRGAVLLAGVRPVAKWIGRSRLRRHADVRSRRGRVHGDGRLLQRRLHGRALRAVVGPVPSRRRGVHRRRAVLRSALRRRSLRADRGMPRAGRNLFVGGRLLFGPVRVRRAVGRPLRRAPGVHDQRRQGLHAPGGRAVRVGRRLLLARVRPAERRDQALRRGRRLPGGVRRVHVGRRLLLGHVHQPERGAGPLPACRHVRGRRRDVRKPRRLLRWRVMRSDPGPRGHAPMPRARRRRRLRAGRNRLRAARRMLRRALSSGDGRRAALCVVVRRGRSSVHRHERLLRAFFGLPGGARRADMRAGPTLTLRTANTMNRSNGVPVLSNA